MGDVSVPILPRVNPGEHYTVTVNFKAPVQPGSYCAFYRFAYGKNKKFGTKVWAEIVVTEPEDEIAKLQREME